ncbi:ATP-binding protein [Cupriavidus gilardii]|uniref:ATP-binding protein n=1 Tax=Cupriavidus gilardii TaxID=82541 RepID=UPI0012E92943|nr:winged helix-turn-helix domain-containing protein [Cupriavidus gilardii]
MRARVTVSSRRKPSSSRGRNGRAISIPCSGSERRCPDGAAGAIAMAPEATLNFGPFSLLPRQRVLLEGGVPVRLGSRAFDLLVTLVERAGEIVPNAELMARVWPNVIVESGALRVHLAGLRKALGDGRQAQRYIVNVPMQGYCFVAQVTPGSAPDLPATTASEAGGAGGMAGAGGPIPTATGTVPAPHAPMAMPLPAQVARVIGRDEVVAELVRELPQRRCVTVTGPAGMGKTTVALAAARQLSPSFDQQAVFVNLAPLKDASLVTNTVTAALGISAPGAASLHVLLTHLRDRRVLIVLDNCEHVIESAAELAEALLTGAPGVHLLMTSREPLRIHGEWVQRLGSLSVPPMLEKLSVHQTLGYASADLFVERVRASLDSFELCEADLPALGRICRALDGIPLALELAAAGVDRLGMRGVAAHLDDRLGLLTRGRRTALPRHQTLRAALDWSYALLPEPERCLLRSLSIFRGRFTAEGARALMDGCAMAGDVDEHLYNLVSKSLLMSDVSGEVAQYWLLETTREYGLAQMESHGETARVSRLHAGHMVQLADAAERARPHQPQGEWLARHAYLLDDFRFALHWSLSERGDLNIGAALAGASAPLWYALSHMAEYLSLVERLLELLPGTDALDPAREIAVREAHGHALWNSRGAGPAAIATFERALELAQRTNSIPDQLHALWGLWLVSNSLGDYPLTVRRANQYGELAPLTGNPADAVVHDRMMTLSMHFTGQHARANFHARRVLAQPLNVNVSARRSGFQFDQRVAALMTLARILWLQGFPDSALDHAEGAVERALNINHSLSLCFAISVGCGPVAFWSGDGERAERYTALLRKRAAEYALTFWGHFGEGYALVLGRRRGDVDHADVPANWPRSLRDTLCTLDADLVQTADFERGRTGVVPWISPELLRIEGERLRRLGDAEAAERSIRAGLAMADEQGARSLSLRCAMSLADLLADVGSRGPAIDVLAPVYEAFTEGLGTADLQAASCLLKRLA